MWIQQVSFTFEGFRVRWDALKYSIKMLRFCHCLPSSTSNDATTKSREFASAKNGGELASTEKNKIIKEFSYTDGHWLLITEDKMMGDEEKLVLRLDLPCLTFSPKCHLTSRFLPPLLLQQLLWWCETFWFSMINWASGTWQAVIKALRCLAQSAPHQRSCC